MSVIFIDRKTGKPVAEIFADRLKREGAHSAHFEVLTYAEWVGRYNRLVREAGGVEPSDEAFLAAVEPRAEG